MPGIALITTRQPLVSHSMPLSATRVNPYWATGLGIGIVLAAVVGQRRCSRTRTRIHAAIPNNTNDHTVKTLRGTPHGLSTIEKSTRDGRSRWIHARPVRIVLTLCLSGAVPQVTCSKQRPQPLLLRSGRWSSRRSL